MITIRPLTPADWKEFQRLNNEVFEDNVQYDPDLDMNWPFSSAGEKYYQESLSKPTHITFGAEEDGNLVGYAACAPRNFGYRKKKYLEIDNIGVSPEYRSKGVGSMLITEVKNWAKEQGFNTIFVTTNFENEKARRFYEANGGKEMDVSYEIEV